MAGSVHSLSSLQKTALLLGVPAAATVLYILYRRYRESREPQLPLVAEEGLEIGVRVPRRALKSLIGHRGATINQLRQQTGAHIDVEEEEEEEEEEEGGQSLVHISGSPGQVCRAKAAVLGIVAGSGSVAQQLGVPSRAGGRSVGSGDLTGRAGRRRSGARGHGGSEPRAGLAPLGRDHRGDKLPADSAPCRRLAQAAAARCPRKQPLGSRRGPPGPPGTPGTPAAPPGGWEERWDLQWEPDTGNREPDTGKEEPDTEKEWLKTWKAELDTGNGEPDTGKKELDTGKVQPDTGKEWLKTWKVELDTGKEEPDTGKELDTGKEWLKTWKVELDTGNGEPDTGKEWLKTGKVEPDTGKGPDTGNGELDTGKEWLKTGKVQPDTGKEETNTGKEGPDTRKEELKTWKEWLDTGKEPDTGKEWLKTGNGEPDTGKELDTGKKELDTGKVQPDTGKEWLKTGKEGPDTRREGPDTGKEWLKTGKVQPDTGKEWLKTGKEELKTGKEEPDTGKEELKTGKVQPDTGKVGPDTGKEEPDTGDEEPVETGDEEPREPPVPKFEEEPLDVFVSAAESPGRFWVQILGSRRRQLGKLMDEMGHFYRGCPALPAPSVLPGAIVAAPYPPAGGWYRARVLGPLANGHLRLCYVDFGDTGQAPPDALRALRSDFLSLPFQAIECSLAGIVPNGGAWAPAALEEFARLTHCARWTPLLARIRSYCQAGLCPRPSVQLFTQLRGQSLDVAAELVRLGYAVPGPPEEPPDNSIPEPGTSQSPGDTPGDTPGTPPPLLSLPGEPGTPP